MLAFSCPLCAHLVTFQSVLCLNCGSRLGFDASARTMRAVADASDGLLCANAELAGCNWLAALPDGVCASCALTRTRPADSAGEELGRFAEAEAAKRWLLFELGDLGLPIHSWRERDGGLAFDLLSSCGEPVTTGHADGVITLDLAEADPASREPRRVQLEEPYRTVLGHLRHEVGHYYQPILVSSGSQDETRMRELFGDERTDYRQALDAHYADGAPENWRESYVSAYAAAHPWEDWAESFAHYLHIRDTLQTAAAYGVTVAGPSIALADEAPLGAEPLDPLDDVDRALDSWIPMTFALNQISRSMGLPDTYPFLLPLPALEKLRFIGRLVAQAAAAPTADSL